MPSSTHSRVRLVERARCKGEIRPKPTFEPRTSRAAPYPSLKSALDQATEQKGRYSVGALISSNPKENYRIIGAYDVPADRFGVGIEN